MLTPLSGGYKNKVAKLEHNGKTYLSMFFDLKDERINEIVTIHSCIDKDISKTLPVRILIDKVENPKQNILLFKYLEGSTIPWEAYTMNHIKLLGLTLSNLHFELKDNKANLKDGIKIQLDQVYEMEQYFKDKGVRQAMNEKLKIDLNVNFNEFTKLFKDIRSLDNQILHLDFVRGNVLFNNKNTDKSLTIDNKIYLSGILDFEKVARGPRVLDIARTLAFLIIDSKYKEEEKIRKYFLYSGYNKRGKMKLPDLKYLEKLVEYFWLYDFFKFLYYSPYESLSLNEHYLRTVSSLKERNLLLPH